LAFLIANPTRTGKYAYSVVIWYIYTTIVSNASLPSMGAQNPALTLPRLMTAANGITSFCNTLPRHQNDACKKLATLAWASEIGLLNCAVHKDLT